MLEHFSRAARGGGGAPTLLCPLVGAFELTHLGSGRTWKLVVFPLLAASYALGGTRRRSRSGRTCPAVNRRLIPLSALPAPFPRDSLTGRMYDLKGTQEARRARDGSSVGKDEDLAARVSGLHLALPEVRKSPRNNGWELPSAPSMERGRGTRGVYSLPRPRNVNSHAHTRTSRLAHCRARGGGGAQGRDSGRHRAAPRARPARLQLAAAAARR